MRWSWATRETLICANSSPLSFRPRASAMSSSPMTRKFSSGADLLIGGFEPWTPPSPLLVPPEAAWRRATSRALPVSSVRPSACRSLWGGTRRTSMTLSPSSAQTQGPPRWGLTVAPVSTSTLAPGSRCPPVTKCALRSLANMVLTRQCADVSKLIYHMRINGDLLNHDLLASFDGQLRASVSASLCGDLPDHSWWQATTESPAVVCTFARPLERPLPPLSPAASCVATWSPSWLTTSAPTATHRVS